MKTTPLLIATALVAALVLAPMAASAGSITFTSPAAGSSFKDSQSYTIAGTVSPAPGQADSAFIAVTNPAGVTVDAGSVPVNPSTGAFSYSTAVGGSSSWVTGAYTIKATDSYGATGTTTFTYTAAPTPVSGLALEIWAAASTLVYAGQTAQISALVAWNNGTAVTSATFKVFLVNPSGTATPLTTAPLTPTSGDYWWNYPVPSGSADGLYALIIGATSGTYSAWTQTSFTVNSQVASQASVSSLGSYFATLQKDLGGNFSALSTAVGTVGSAVSGVSSTLTSVQTTLGNINTAVQALSGLSSQLSSVSSSISTTQTYVLVVAVLAAITLVLELAILIRKIS
jgi:hypothetical protein